MAEWREVELGDVLTLQRGFDLPARERIDGPVPVISSSGVTGYHTVAKAEPPGVVIGRYGSLGTVHWVTSPYWPLNTALWVKDFKGNDPRYISYLLKTVQTDGGTAAAVPGVNRNHLHRMPVRIPSRAAQARIAATLGAFDDLIATNERRIGLLEEFTRAVYQEWFVRFRFSKGDDVVCKESSIGPIPVDWSIYMLSDIAEIVVAGVSPRRIESDKPYIGLEHLPRRSTTLREWGRPESVASRKLLFAAADTLFGRIRPYFHKVAWAPCAGIASSDIVVIRPRGPRALPAFINTVASSDALVAMAVATSNGTKMPRANPDVLMAFPLALPPLDSIVLNDFERIAKTGLELAATFAEQNRSLAATRDLLLPRLVTGRLDISDVDLGDLLHTETLS